MPMVVIIGIIIVIVGINIGIVVVNVFFFQGRIGAALRSESSNGEMVVVVVVVGGAGARLGKLENYINNFGLFPKKSNYRNSAFSLNRHHAMN